MITYLIQMTNGGVAMPRWEIEINAMDDSDAIRRAKEYVTDGSTFHQDVTLWRAVLADKSKWPLVATIKWRVTTQATVEKPT